MLHAQSRTAATFVGRLTIAEQVAHKIAQIIADRLAGDNVAVSIAETGKRTCALAVYFQSARDQEKVGAAVAAAAGRKAMRALRFSRIAAADWVGASLQGLAPVTAGRFVVHGAHDRGRVPINRVGIEIEAALAFGSGHHGTTRGCLLALDRMCKSLRKPRARALPTIERKLPGILDIGTGSGVLAIAAARTLRRPVVATDIDPDAVSVARTNVRLNQAMALVRVAKGNAISAPGLSSAAGFDVIFANILLKTLLRLAMPLRRQIAPGGRIVLSGLLPSQASAALAAYRPLALERRIELDGWVTLVLARCSSPRSRLRRREPRARA